VQTGTYISGLGHVVIAGWVVLGGAMYSVEPPKDIHVTTVAVISQADFEALRSSAPIAVQAVTQPRAPGAEARAPLSPSKGDKPKIIAKPRQRPAATAGTRPDLSAVAKLPQTTVQSAAPIDTFAPQADVIGATLIVPTAPISNVDRAGASRDRLAVVTPSQPVAPRVDTRAAPKPPSDATKSNVTQKATTAKGRASTTVPQKTEKAPDQAATEIVTEANQNLSTSAPQRTSRPKGRPAGLGARAQTAKDIANALAQAEADAAANPSGGAQPSTLPATLPSVAPSGPPLTSGEKTGLRVAVQECWNVNPSSESARITVTVAVSMKKDGTPVASTIRMISASEGNAAAQRSAFDAARRAILRCAKSGYKLPIDKYDRWRDIEMTFNPDKMRIK